MHKKKISFKLSLLLICTIIYSIVIYQKTLTANDIWFVLGQNESSIRTPHFYKETILEWSNGEINISKSEFEKVKQFYIIGNQVDNPDEAALDNLIEREALYQEAINAGFEVSDIKVNESISLQKSLLEESNEFKIFLKGYGTPENDYWEDHFEAMRKAIAINEYISFRKQCYYAQNKDLDQLSINKNWNLEETHLETMYRKCKK